MNNLVLEQISSKQYNTWTQYQLPYLPEFTFIWKLELHRYLSRGCMQKRSRTKIYKFQQSLHGPLISWTDESIMTRETNWTYSFFRIQGE